MSQKKQLVKGTKKIFQQFTKYFLSIIKKQIIWLLRTLFITKRRRGAVNAGFVLPTVAMVSIVVVLLTAAILFRSFERSKNASNVRVNEVVIRAASPALDRAKAKIDELFQDPRLPRSTPSDFSLSQVINDNINQYTFGDETQLKLVKDVNSDGKIDADGETLKTTWKYPVDTDNNGKFDSFTIYGIYFRTPTSTRARSSLEARAQPMDEGATGSRCASDIATSADLVGSQGWYKVGSKLKRSIFVYTTSVPITQEPTQAALGDKYTDYEKFKGNKGFAALEYQQDRERVPLSNNAVIYEDDLEIAPGAGLNLNGRIFTNGNLLTRAGGTIRFYLVSSPKSCYFTEENSKIVVAGNVINSRVNESAAGSSVQVDLFDKNYDASTIVKPNSKTIDDTNKTVPSKTVYGNKAAYNEEAYAKRIDRLVAAADAGIKANTLVIPDEVKEAVDRSLAADASLVESDVRKEQLKIYFRKRTRRVPFAEIKFGDDPLKYGSLDYIKNSPLEGDGNSLRPVETWAFPFKPSDGTTATGYAEIGINANSKNKKIYLTATDPTEQVKANKEFDLGDRVLVGNNLPELWYDSDKKAFVQSDQGQIISGKEWDYKLNATQTDTVNTTATRKRFSQAFQLDNIGITDRDDFWEKSAAQKPTGPLDVVGGLRVVTGAGIYLPNDYNPTTQTFTNSVKVVWPDTMPMGVTSQSQGLPDDKTPYLQMRATVVYHYQDYSYDPKTPGTYQTPIACVSSFHDPTIKYKYKSKDKDGKDIEIEIDTAKNASKDAAGNDLPNGDSNGKSNNGVVYSASNLATTGYDTVLSYQAELKYPNGRLVNERLASALKTIKDGKNLTLSEKSSVDSAMCALKILDGTIGSITNDKVPNNAIKETAFLDARQVKAIDKVVNSRNYDLDVEVRQPLEIRATVIDLDSLRKKSKNDGEFLFPNSGIIYATRDDALPDQSDTSPDVSATDFKLDPTRRPNGIMLINGSDLSRNDTYKSEEKGLILASNLPVYIQGDFNKHTEEEFNETNSWGNDFYKRKTLDPNFACRKGQFTSCSTGETWRPATVIADGITVLSSNFKLGYRQDGDYDLRDNYGNYALGYDLNGNGNIETAQITLDETAIKFDINGDGDMLDTAVDTIDEPKIGTDLNGDGDNLDLAVKITESNITATVAARLNGFWDNNFVTSYSLTDSQYSGSTTGRLDSSYLNNFVTPIQRRVKFSEYVMEICRKRTVTACKPDDWVVGYDLDGNGNFTTDEKSIKGNQLVKKLADASITSIQTNRLWAGTTATFAPSDSNEPLKSLYPRRVAFLRYSTTDLPLAKVVRKDGTSLTNVPSSPIDYKLVLDNDKTPVPLGISKSGSTIKATYFPYSNTLTINSTDYLKHNPNSTSQRPNQPNNALWFRTWKTLTDKTDKNYSPNYPVKFENTLTGNRATEQPLLIPVLQIQYPFLSPSDTSTLAYTGDAASSNWMQAATATETNLVFAQGNTPERPPGTNDIGESNGGLENFVRYLETWKNITHKASGSFIQFKRSNYATAPWQVMTSIYTNHDVGYTTSTTGTSFGYPQGYRQTTTADQNAFSSTDPATGTVTVEDAKLGRSPFYVPPSRFWGYDVALLTQLPDLFSQRFTAPSVNAPNEFYREVGRDDNWVKTLLCAAQADTKGYATADSKYGSDYKYALSSDQRPSSCP